MDMSKIQRALGVIEGVCVGMADKPAEIIETAVNEIDCELENVSGYRNAASQDNASCNDRPGDINSPRGTFSASEMDELLDRLHRFSCAYMYSEPFDRTAAFSDMKKAAELIEHLREIIKDLEYCACAERP